MQVLVIGIAFIWLSRFLEDSKVRELQQRVDARADAVEDVIVQLPTGMHFSENIESVRELARDPHYFFVLLNSKKELWDQTLGPDRTTRAEILDQFQKPDADQSRFFSLMISGQTWFVQREKISNRAVAASNPSSQVPQMESPNDGYLYAAIDAAPVMSELAVMKRILLAGGFVFILVTSLGTSLIVSHTTSNLKALSQSISKIDPHKPSWTFNGEPRTAEEQQLFSSFRGALTAIIAATETQRLFIAHASHELKTPVSGLSLALEVMLSKPRRPNEYEETGRALLRSVRSLQRLSHALLDLAAFENTQSISLEKFELARLLQQVTGRWQDYADEKGITLHLRTAADIHLEMLSNENWLDIALGNFLENAIKYSTKGTGVEISANFDEGRQTCRLIISDHGTGMTPESLSRLGEYFFRANEARTADLSYGLGFAQAKRIITILGGTIAVESSLGLGTKVIVDLPTAPLPNRPH